MIALATAQKIAERIRAELAPFCDRIDIVGSVRRKRPQCGDIDLVLLAKDGAMNDLRKRAKQAARVIREGTDNMMLNLANGMQVDLFFARPCENTLLAYEPGNYGMRLLAMTGSKEHNIELAKIAKTKGLHFNPYRGLMRGGKYHPKPDGGMEYKGGEVYRGEDELEILRELGVGWIEPEAREVRA